MQTDIHGRVNDLKGILSGMKKIVICMYMLEPLQNILGQFKLYQLFEIIKVILK